jgi:hypothetical protein
MPAGPYEGQVPSGEYAEERALEGRMQLIEITVTGHWLSFLVWANAKCYPSTT